MRVELTATHPVVLCALAVDGPATAVLTALAGVAGSVLLRYRTRLSRCLPFNLGAVALSASAAAWIFELLGGAAAGNIEAMLWPLFAATTVYFLVNTGLVSIVVAVEKQNYQAPTKASVREYLTDEWLPAVKGTIRPSTFNSYVQHVECHIVPHIGSVKLQKLSGSQVNALYATLAESGKKDGRSGLSPQTIHHVHACLCAKI